MALPLFYFPGIFSKGAAILLGEDISRHIVQVLRMNASEKINLTNGSGYKAEATIIKAEKKKCEVVISELEYIEPIPYSLHLCMAFTKNSSRNEWLLEKATELGVSSITPLACTRSIREKFRFDRWNNILVSALIQSQQYYLPRLHEMVALQDVYKNFKDCHQKLLAHCIEDIPRIPVKEALLPGRETVIMIGPEGDFTTEEVNHALQENFKSISLGTHRLRTETAALAVCTYFNMINCS